jgi:polyvinyl alcohol dehydrogenase (cytochrome)
MAALLVAPAASAQESGPCSAPPHPAGEWPSYGHDLANTRSQPLEETIGPETVGGLTESWMFDTGEEHTGGALNTTPIVWGGCVFIAPTSGEVFALDADSGDVVWMTQLIASPQGYGGGIVGAPAVVGDRLIVVVNVAGAPYLTALGLSDGSPLWTTVIDETATAITNASVTAYDGMAMVGFSGSSGGTPAERGGFTVVDTEDGAVLAKTWTIPDEDFEAGYAGASIWSTAAVDEATGYAYVGAGNPHSDRVEHERTNAILKIDLDRERDTFGQIVGSYKGRSDNYVGGLDQQPACQDLPPVYYFASFDATCGQLDLDFGASPNLFHDADGALVVGALQKAGVYHAVDAETMAGRWEHVAGVPCFACNASSAAYDGERVHVSASPPGQLWALDGEDGGVEWVAPLGSGLHYFSVTAANGVTYTTDTYGFLNAFDAVSGEQLLKEAMGFEWTGVNAGSVGVSGSSGVAVARNTVYAAAGSRLFAYRLDGSNGDPPSEPPPADPPPAAAGAVVLTAPGGQYTGYLPPVVTVPVAGELTYSNYDAAPHDVVARTAKGSDDQPWCAGYSPGACPLFWSKLIGLGTSTPVLGTENLVAGESYEFFCTVHTGMRGTLIAQ